MWFVLAVVALLLLSPSKPAVDVYERPRLGLSVVVPDGWTVVRRPMSNCTDPVQRIALRRGEAVVQIVESLHWGVDGFPSRPRRFTLTGEPRFLACCPPVDGKGWFIPFRDGSRGFYAYVYLDEPGTRAEALRILDSLNVIPHAEGLQCRPASSVGSPLTRSP
ncbi:MAG: hypothetical protein ACRDQT_02425 [Gaiellaceae bacterium]